MKPRVRNLRIGFSVTGVLALLFAIIVAEHGFAQLEYNHAAAVFVAVGGVLLAVAIICAWFAWASSLSGKEPTPKDPDRAM